MGDPDMARRSPTSPDLDAPDVAVPDVLVAAVGMTWPDDDRHPYYLAPQYRAVAASALDGWLRGPLGGSAQRALMDGRFRRQVFPKPDETVEQLAELHTAMDGLVVRVPAGNVETIAWGDNLVKQQDPPSHIVLTGSGEPHRFGRELAHVAWMDEVPTAVQRTDAQAQRDAEQLAQWEAAAVECPGCRTRHVPVHGAPLAPLYALCDTCTDLLPVAAGEAARRADAATWDRLVALATAERTHPTPPLTDLQYAQTLAASRARLG
jgi:hypothetical protein